MNAENKHRILGLIVAGVSVILSGIFVYILMDTKLLTWQLLAIIGAVLAGAAVGIWALARDSRRRIRSIIAMVLAVVLLGVETMGSYYVLVAKKTLEDITEPVVDVTEVGIYVRNEDAAKILADTGDYVFGILAVQERKATDTALDHLKETFGKAPTVQEFADIEELMDAFLTEKTVSAIVVPKAFLDILEEIEGHQNDLAQIREIHEVLDETEQQPDEPVKNKDVFSIYISGIDCRGRISKRSRSDVNIIATVNVKTGQILLVSTPRDYFVPLTISNGVEDKLTNAGIYGVEVSKGTLGMLYDIDIDYYFRVNFDGFEGIIDALGGITVYSKYAFTTDSCSYQKGENHLDGRTALEFARERYAFAAGDRQRGKNQMEVIRAVIDKMVSPAFLANYKETMDSISGTFQTSMPYEKIAELVQHQLSTGTKWNITTYSADGKGKYRKPYSQKSNSYVMIPTQKTVDRAKELMAQVANGEVPQV